MGKEKYIYLDTLFFIILGFILAVNTVNHPVFNGIEKIKNINGSNIGYFIGVIATAALLLYSVLSFTISEKYYFKLKNTALIIIICTLVLIPMTAQIYVRFNTDNPLEFAHDGGVIQTETSSRLLLAGKNPYSASFKNTPLINVGVQGIIIHNPYLPLTFIIPAPIIYLFDKTGLYFDQRIIYFILYFVIIIFSGKLFKNKYTASIFRTFFALNPLLIPYMIYGMNEIYVIAFIFIAVLFISKNKYILSMIFLGLACAIKQFAWLIVPFFIVYIWKKDKIHFNKNILILFITTIVILLPFIIWSPFDFIDDTILFNAGKSFANYPLGGTPGLGFSMLPVIFEMVKDRNAYFPCIIFITIFCLPLFIFLGYRLLKNARLYNVMIYSGLFSASIFFFSRVFHFNYLFFIVFLIGTGVLLFFDVKNSP